MRQTLGCAAMIAAVAFVVGLVGALFMSEATFSERLTTASMTGAMAFVAALLLVSRDRRWHRTAMRTVRERLLARDDVSDAVFAASFANVDSSLITLCRYAVAKFFGVPAEKIHPTDDLNTDLHFKALEPSFHFFVVCHVLQARNIATQHFTFKTANLRDMCDLAREIQRTLDAQQN